MSAYGRTEYAGRIDEKYVDELEWGGVEERYFELNDKSLSDYEGSCYRFSFIGHFVNLIHW